MWGGRNCWWIIIIILIFFCCMPFDGFVDGFKE